jgi:hypothetical protein
MKAKDYLKQLFFDIDDFVPDTLSSVIRYVQSHKNYNPIIIWAINSDIFALYLVETYHAMSNDPEWDLQVAALLVILANANCEVFLNEVSRAAYAKRIGRWSTPMAAGYLLSREVTNETIRFTA